MTFGQQIINRIRELQMIRNWSTYHLAMEAELSSATVLSWYSRNSIPTIKALHNVCNAFGITMSEFFNNGSERIELTEQEKILLKQWSLLHANEREAFLQLMMTVNENIKRLNT